MVVGVAPELQWWPSPCGPDDQLGMLNHISAATRLEALASSARAGSMTSAISYRLCEVDGFPESSHCCGVVAFVRVEVGKRPERFGHI